MKRCSKCKTERRRDEFYRDSSRSDGLNPWCKICAKEWRLNNRATTRAQSRRWRLANPEKARASIDRWVLVNKDHLAEKKRKWRVENAEKVRVYQRKCKLRAYSLTPREYEELLVAQGGGCAICGDQPDGNLSVDHDHETGEVRGLLCRPCNLGLGCMRDDLDVMSSAAMYLRQRGLPKGRGMIYATVSGRLTKDAETKTIGQNTVCNFSVASNGKSPQGEKITSFVDCGLWGKRGASVAQYLKKGTAVTVVGRLSTREHNGKTYIRLDVSEVDLMGSRSGAPAAAGGGGYSDDDYGEPAGGDGLPF